MPRNILSPNGEAHEPLLTESFHARPFRFKLILPGLLECPFTHAFLC